MSSIRGQLFGDDNDYSSHVKSPLADRMRPSTFDDFVGQLEVLGPGAPLRQAIERDSSQSIILWGPRGTGKPRAVDLIATVTQSHFISFSAVLSGIKEIKTVMAEAVDKRKRLGRRTILFVDEIHRFNKSQQDAFLPRVETGDINLIEDYKPCDICMTNDPYSGFVCTHPPDMHIWKPIFHQDELVLIFSFVQN